MADNFKNEQMIKSVNEPQLKKESHKNLFLAVLGLLILLVVTGYILIQESTSIVRKGAVSQAMEQTKNVKNIPFKEMTIPYLRTREYESSLGNRELYSSGNTYNQYITSYNSDGLKINGLLTIPTGERPEDGWPAIIFLHGYIPPTQYRTTEKYVDYVDYLARNGFVVFKIDLRGHGDSDGQPGGGYYGSDYIIDTLHAYDALGKTDFVNPQAIGLWGHSMAGNIILRSMAVRPSIPVSVIWAGAVYSYVDLKKYGIQDSSYQPQPSDSQRINRRRELFEKHGSPSAESSFWKQVAATSYLNDMKGAIEIHHAIDDDIVDIGYSRDLVNLLSKTSVPHGYHEYSSGGHNILGENFTVAMDRTVTFFNKYLK